MYAPSEGWAGATECIKWDSRLQEEKALYHTQGSNAVCRFPSFGLQLRTCSEGIGTDERWLEALLLVEGSILGTCGGLTSTLQSTEGRHI